ncbi:MAG: MFS transporter [Betaproteobacteria bacterium]|jgi:MFS family permease|nr:MFS transporter [Betaproteobacteria bacterium]MDH4294150.1 MFS transporter [Betaproteobacteria bacterium]MDH5341507.1 MFS transporter [Betaproteobacteria bacterium]
MHTPNWRTPAVVLFCGGMILTIALGVRHTFGLYLQPMTADLGIGREAFAFAIAIQNLLYGISQPITGLIADKFGTARVLIGGAICYALGLYLMSVSTTGMELTLSAGLLIGASLGCSGFSIVFGVIGRAFPPEKRSVALGIAGAAGSFGQFSMLPYGQWLINQVGWMQALVILGITVLVIIPLSSAMVEDKNRQAAILFKQSATEALREAMAHRGFLLLCTAYTVCGFQLLFIAVHFPAYLVDQRMTPETGMIGLALIGFFNMIGSYMWGWLGGRHTKKYLLSLLYFTRSVAIAIFILLPVTPLTVYVFSATIGFLWLGTVPLTGGLIAHVFGVRYLSTLTGIAFFFHQVGSFAGVWIGGYVFDATGSYTVMWLLTIGMGIVAALLNLPIDDRQIDRAAAKPVQA